MALSFYTKNHQMTFVDALTGHVQSAGSLLPNHNYDVYFVIQNDADVMELNVQVLVTHTAFGINLPGGTSLITRQPTPVNVPPEGPGGNGLATVDFGFRAPPGGHGCLMATIQPSGPTLYQNTDVAAVPIGVPSTLSFLVYGSATPATITLTLTETLESGAMVPAAESWNPLLVAPPGTGPAVPIPAPVNLNLAANAFYSVGLQVTVPPTASAAHIFHIEGFIGGQYVGEVDLKVTPSPMVVKPDPYIHGGYQSPDVILYDPTTGLEVPLGGLPGGPWDTTLQPNTNYGFAARVNNASSTAARNTVVRFWEFPGGVGTAGTLVDVQSATVPPLGSVEVPSAKPFLSAPAGQHKCAVVSIYNALAGTCPDATTAAQVPAPDPYGHSCSAWRNTTAKAVVPGILFKIELGVIDLDKDLLPRPRPVEIEVHTFHLPADWHEHDRVKEVAMILEQGAAPRALPLFLLPALREIWKPAKLEVDLKAEAETKVERIAEAPRFRVKPLRDRSAPFTVVGKVPEDAKPGDIYLVQVTAHYPETRRAPGRSVQFLQILHVKEG